jgi:hypothetical protein
MFNSARQLFGKIQLVHHQNHLTCTHKNADISLPSFVHDEFRKYLRCGIFNHGFLRVKCNDCRFEHLARAAPSFSCEPRCYYPCHRNGSHPPCWINPREWCAKRCCDIGTTIWVCAELNLREVAEGAGVNRGNIYHYFGSR